LTDHRKPTPEELLRRLEGDDDHRTLGRLKIFLGYASGVGKTFRMLDEGRRRSERGQDVIIGAIQPHLSAENAKLASRLEVVSLQEVQGIRIIDIPAILRRAPKVCLIDGLAYDNPPASVHAKRWQDVAQLLEAGISVVTSVNLQHIEEKRAAVETITGKRVSQTVPLSFLQTADEIVIVDAPAEDRISFSDDSKQEARQKLSQTQLSELREIALFLTADVVDKQLERYLSNHGIKQSWGTQERILILVTPDTDAVRMLESGARNRDRFHGELIVAHLNRPDWNEEQKQTIQRALAFAREKSAEIVELDEDDSITAILRLARQRGVTQIFVGQKSRENWWERLVGNELDRLIRSADGIDVRVFPHL
jgi:two-component system, OmpR family, sensor histidine kinase KdpD